MQLKSETSPNSWTNQFTNRYKRSDDQKLKGRHYLEEIAHYFGPMKSEYRICHRLTSRPRFGISFAILAFLSMSIAISLRIGKKTIGFNYHLIIISCLPHKVLPIREERRSARILKIVNTLGNVRKVTVTIFATSIANTLFMIIGTNTVSICCIS